MSIVKRRKSIAGAVGGYGGSALGAYLGGPIGRYAGGKIGGYVGSKLAGMGAKKRKAVGVKNETSMTTRVALCKKKGNVSKGNRKKTVKVSRSLRKKIGKVIEQKKIHGNWTELRYGYLVGGSGNQSVGVPVIPDQFNNDWSFLPEEFLHCASVLFNGKVESPNNRGIVDYGNLGITSGGEAAPFNKDTYGCTAKFHVVRSKISYHLKNNTQTTMIIRAYTVAPKKAGYYGNDLSVPNGSFQSSQFQNLNPIYNWSQSLATKTGTNVINASVNTIGLYPEHDPRWTALYKYEVCDIVMDPGQSTTFDVAGPSDLELDFQKMYQNQAFIQLQKFCRGTFFIIKHDLVQGVGDNFTTIGRFKSGSTGTLIMEKKFTCKISVPESTGVKVENVGTAVNNIELNNRKPVFFFKQYGPNTVPLPSQVTRIDEEQPATQI